MAVCNESRALIKPCQSFWKSLMTPPPKVADLAGDIAIALGDSVFQAGSEGNRGFNRHGTKWEEPWVLAILCIIPGTLYI